MALARKACVKLAEEGVTARIVGSLATGRFGSGSDIDFLIVDCQRELKYGIEGIVEDLLGSFPFDVLYLEEIPDHRRDRLVREAADARDLR